jgi:hypothetical protein
MSYETLGDLIRAMHDDPNDEFAAHLDRVALRDAIRWARDLYEAGEALYDELCMYDDKPDTVKALEAWEEARQLKTEES